LSSVKSASRTVVERRRELAKLLAGSAVPSTGSKPVQADPQAAALGFYIRAAGWTVTDQAVGTWLNLGMVLFLEMAAALSLTVAAALRPEGPPTAPTTPAEPKVAPEPQKPAIAPESHPSDDDKHNGPPSPLRKGRAGRPRDVLPTQAIERLRAKGGNVSGSLNGMARLIGSRSKTSVHRLLHELHAAGRITLQTGPNGVAVSLA
jgi:hypothetical protein